MHVDPDLSRHPITEGGGVPSSDESLQGDTPLLVKQGFLQLESTSRGSGMLRSPIPILGFLFEETDVGYEHSGSRSSDNPDFGVPSLRQPPEGPICRVPKAS